jgi:hypothetical protein
MGICSPPGKPGWPSPPWSLLPEDGEPDGSDWLPDSEGLPESEGLGEPEGLGCEGLGEPEGLGCEGLGWPLGDEGLEGWPLDCC